jgi:hypothetical protein
MLMTGPAADCDPEPMDAQYTYDQRIRVESGVAYGVLGANLHVWGRGVLMYLLETWPDTPGADPEWLRALPGRLLNARDGVAGFTKGAAELNQLHQWRRSAPRLAVRWLYGPAEADNAVLAAKFAGESAADNWKVVVATLGPGTVVPVLDTQDLGLGAAAGVLLAIDAAGHWPRTSLARLLSNKLFRRPDDGTRTRILMTSRDLEPWPAIQHKVISSGQPAVSSQLATFDPRAAHSKVADDCGPRDGR